MAAAAEQLLEALRNRDLAVLDRLLHPDVRFYSVSVDASPAEVRSFGRDEFLQVVSQSAEPLVERLMDPQIMVEGPIASLWTEYDFYVGDRFSHCGHAAFQFALQGGIWRLTAETYTVRTASCRRVAQ